MTSIFFIFYQKKAFLNYEKWFLFPLKALFVLDILNILQLFLFLFTVSRFKGSDRKRSFSNHVLQLKGRLVSSFRPFLFFIILYINGDWVQKKNQVNFFMVSFKISYFQKSFACTDCLGLFAKIKKGYRTSF